jgi:hypothetical protein
LRQSLYRSAEALRHPKSTPKINTQNQHPKSAPKINTQNQYHRWYESSGFFGFWVAQRFTAAIQAVISDGFSR